MEAQDQGVHIAIAGDFNLCKSVGDRGRVMNEFCQQFNLTISDEGKTFDTSWSFRSSLGNVRSIDYIIFSAGLSLIDGYASREVDLGSDHRCLKASFEFMPMELHKKKRQKPLK